MGLFFMLSFFYFILYKTQLKSLFINIIDYFIKLYLKIKYENKLSG